MAYRGFLAPGAKMGIGAPHPRRVGLASAEAPAPSQRFLEYLGVNGTHYWIASTPFSTRLVRLTSAESALLCYGGGVWGGASAANAFGSIGGWMEPIFEFLYHHFQLGVSDWQAPKAPNLPRYCGVWGGAPDCQRLWENLGVNGTNFSIVLTTFSTLLAPTAGMQPAAAVRPVNSKCLFR